MILNKLKIFFKIAEIGSKTKTPDLPSTTPSPASASIDSLEIIYQVELFKRIGRSITLSDKGKRFLPQAQSVI